MFKTLAFISFFTITLIPAAPAAVKPEVQTRISASAIHQDETVQFNLEIHWPREEGPYVFALPVLPLKNLVLERQGESQETYRKDGKDWSQKSFIAVLRPLAPGEGKIEDFVLPYVNTGSQESGELLVTAPHVKISKAPFKIKKEWGLAASAVIGIPLAVIAIVRLRRKKKAPEVRSPEELAVENFLTHLRSESFNRDATKEKLHRAGSEFRNLLHSVYKIGPSRISERELIEELKRREIPADEWKTVSRLVEKLNEAKYMGQSLTDSDFSAIKKEIETFAEGKRFSTSSV